MSETRILIGGRAHTLDQIHQVGALGYPFAEISLLEPSQVEAQLEEMARLKTVYEMYYIAHYPNEGNPFDVKTHAQRLWQRRDPSDDRNAISAPRR